MKWSGAISAFVFATMFSNSSIACPQWSLSGQHLLELADGTKLMITFRQSGDSINGVARWMGRGAFGELSPNAGQLDQGVVDGTDVAFKIIWNSALVDLYEGAIAPGGSVTGSVTDSHGSMKLNWTLQPHARCGQAGKLQPHWGPANKPGPTP